MSWIQDGGSNPWYANFNNTALDFITFNGVQVWASSYSFSITVSYKVGAYGFSVEISDPSDCESEYTDNLLTYVSRFSVSVSNVVGCDKIIFYPMGAKGLDAMEFTFTGVDFEAIWSAVNFYYNIETNSGNDPTFFIDRFYLSTGTNVPFGNGYALYERGTYYTRSSLQSDPSVNISTKPNGAINNPNRALKYYHSINLPGSYYYEMDMDSTNWRRWWLSSNSVIVPLWIQRGNMDKRLSIEVDMNASATSGRIANQSFDIGNATRTVTASSTDPVSGAWA